MACWWNAALMADSDATSVFGLYFREGIWVHGRGMDPRIWRKDDTCEGGCSLPVGLACDSGYMTEICSVSTKLATLPLRSDPRLQWRVPARWVDLLAMMVTARVEYSHAR